MILFINKPRGMTSFDVVRQLKKIYPGQKVGHAGTLDPLAEGLLIALIGQDTKRQAEFMGLRKTYQFDAVFRATSATDDLEGPITMAPENVSRKITKEKLKETISELTGEIELPVPKYSAIKIDGQRSYQLARAGKDFDEPIRKAVVYSLTIPAIGSGCDFKPNFELPRELAGLPCIRFEAEVAKGVYIRALARMIGEKLGTGALVTKLVRTKIGDHKLEDAVNLANLDK